MSLLFQQIDPGKFNCQVSLDFVPQYRARTMGHYGKLAAMIGAHQEMALFRQFAALNAKSLLYMQSELVHLEAELSSIEVDDTYSGDSQKETFRVSVFDLKESCGTGKDLQWRKVLEIREKLKEYSK